MNCRKCRAELERYLDNELAQGERAIVEQHVAACAECRQKLSELQTLNSVLDARPQVEPEPDYLAGFNDRFWHEVKRRRRMSSAGPKRKLLPVFWTRIGTVAAAALLLVAVGLVGYRSWHSFFEHPGAALSQPAPASIPAPEAATRTAEPKSASRVAEPGTPKSEPQAEEAKPVEPMPARTNPKAPSPGLEMKTASRGEERMSAQKLGTQQASSSAASVSGQSGSGARKGGLRLGEGTPMKRADQPSGQEITGVNVQALDTAIYPEERLDTKPLLISIPDASDGDRMKYPDLEVPVWVVVEKDGSVSRVESRSATASAGLTGVALALARQAQFTPGKKAGNAVRVGKTIVVRITALKQKGN